jgi:hypothetical protein
VSVLAPTGTLPTASSPLQTHPYLTLITPATSFLSPYNATFLKIWPFSEPTLVNLPFLLLVLFKLLSFSLSELDIPCVAWPDSCLCLLVSYFVADLVVA